MILSYRLTGDFYRMADDFDCFVWYWWSLSSGVSLMTLRISVAWNYW